MSHKAIGSALFLMILLALPSDAQIAGSRHDLSTNFEPYSDQVCAFCHTPHGANIDVVAPLWNRFVNLSATYTLYSSATFDSVGSQTQPNPGISGVCLGCHDGTSGSSVYARAVYNGINGSTKHDLINAPGPGGTPDLTSYPNCRNCHGQMYGDPPAFWSGTNLADEHPIAIAYPTAAVDPAFHTPPDLTNGWDDTPFYGGRIECPTCHAVHDPTNTPFLRKPNAGSALCLTCHTK
jgi:predicted CXXCH cytochrome family protein